jgi:hypothetical protein
MMADQETNEKIICEYGSMPDSDGLTIEFMTETGATLLEGIIDLDDNDQQIIEFIKVRERARIPLDVFLQGIEAVSKRVHSYDYEDNYGGEPGQPPR